MKRSRFKRKPPVRVESPYRDFVQSLPCSRAGLGGGQGDVVAAHATLSANEKGTALKVDDTQVIPLCHQHHQEFDGHAQPRFTAGWSKQDRYNWGRTQVRLTRGAWSAKQRRDLAEDAAAMEGSRIPSGDIDDGDCPF
jgi:hypothetical protein